MEDLKKIKNAYGEEMMHFCRTNFPTIRETPGLLYEILTKLFHPSKQLIEDINKSNDFKANFISIIMQEYLSNDQRPKEIKVTKTPAELLKEEGYILYECKTEEDIQSFRHYYKREDGKILPKYVPGTVPPPFDGEELCTFNGDRLDRCYVFFAVKENADQIKREDYIGKEERQDPYGTSVISIQISKDNIHSVSIKNRYNHTVDHPDATFGNELDNISPGLTQAFENEYGIKINRKSATRIHLKGYVKANDGKYYKYNFERNAVYYCPDNIIIIDGEVKQYDKSRYLVIGRVIIDLQEKEIEEFDKDFIGEDAFIRTLYDETRNSTIKSIRIETNKETKEKTITINDDIIIIVDQTNQMKYYKNPHIKEINRFFMSSDLVGHETIEEVDLPNVEIIGTDFMDDVSSIKKISLPKCKKIGISALRRAINIEEINLPEVEEIGDSFLEYNKKLKNINLPKCRKIGNDFLKENKELKELDLPEVRYIGQMFLARNTDLRRINLPKCQKINTCFLMYNEKLEEIVLPEIDVIMSGFLPKNKELKSISLPNCTEIRNDFLASNEKIESVDLPRVETIGDHFLHMARELPYLVLPRCKVIGNYFLNGGGEFTGKSKLTKIDLPEVEYIGNDFMEAHSQLEIINAPKVKAIGNKFLTYNKCIKIIELPELLEIHDDFMKYSSIETIRIPKCKSIGSNFLKYNYDLKEMDLSGINYVDAQKVTDIESLRNYLNKGNDTNIIYNNDNNKVL